MEDKKTGYPHIDRPWMKYYDGMYIPEGEPDLTMVELLKKRNEYRLSKIAYEYYGKQVTYREMWERVDIAAKVLDQIGVKKGDIILSMVPNIPEEEELWFGASQLGAITDYIDPRPDSMDPVANSKKLLEIIKYEKPKFIIAVDMCYLGMIKPIEHELKEMGINDVIILHASDSMDDMAMYSYLKDVVNYEKLKKGITDIKEDIPLEVLLKTSEMLKANMKSQNEMMQISIKTSPLRIHNFVDLARECKNSKLDIVRDPELINYIGHTSGTSGARPKPIPLTNRNANASVIQCEIAGVGPAENETSLHILPGFAPFGRYNNDIQTYYNKGINIHVPEFLITDFGYLLPKYKPSAIMTPPAFLTALPYCKYLEDEDLSYIDKVVYGGDAMTYEDEERINDWLKRHGSHAEVEKGHGMSEFCGCGTYAKNDYNKPDTIGIPAPKTIYTMINPDVEDHMEPVRFEEGMDKLRGEIAVSANHVTDGILHGNVIVPHQELDGRSYIRTKDIGYMDRDGCFFIDERKGRSFARIDGFKIKPSEIEKPIEENENVKYARIVPYYDENIRGQMPMCHLVLEKNGLTEEEQIEIVKDIVYNNIIGNPNMNSRQIPSKFKIREELPLNKGNKVDFKALEAEGLTGDEINVVVNETNVAVESIEIFKDRKGIVRRIK